MAHGVFLFLKYYRCCNTLFHGTAVVCMTEIKNIHPRDWAHDSKKVYLCGIVGVAIIVALFFTYFKSRTLLVLQPNNSTDTTTDVLSLN